MSESLVQTNNDVGKLQRIGQTLFTLQPNRWMMGIEKSIGEQRLVVMQFTMHSSQNLACLKLYTISSINIRTVTQFL